MDHTTAAATLFLLSSLSLLSISQSEAFLGRWKVLSHHIGISAMHMALLPNGRILIFDRTDFGFSNISMPNGRCRDGDKVVGRDCTAHSIEFNPSTRSVRPLVLLSNTFCSSGSLLPNGTFLQTGGFNGGDHAIRTFSPCDQCDWVEHMKPNLAVRRWYATDQILPDGRVIVIGGRKQFNYEFVPKSKSSDSYFKLPFLQETSDQWENNLYPFVHLSPDGNLFIFANTKSILFDYTRNVIVKSFPEIPGGIARNYPSTGSSVMLPLRLDTRAPSLTAEVMVCGGTLPAAFEWAKNGNFTPASSSCGRVVITSESPEWVMEEMPMGRVMGDMVLLPTGDVLVVNGAGKGSAGWELGREPVLNPVLYRTGVTGCMNRTFEVLEPNGRPRLYHSTAVVLPDGRVLIGGSNTHEKYRFSGVMYPTDETLEAFWPPYLYPKAPRPTIVTISGRDGHESCVQYGERVAVEFVLRGFGIDGVRITMVAPSFTTHSFSMNQRLLVLEVERVRLIAGRRYVADVVVPASSMVAPPGYYMLFVVHDGIPSHGSWLRISQ